MGKFVVGLLFGGALGAGAALLMAAKPESQDGIVATMQSNVQRVVDAAKRAASAREQELWQDYRNRTQQG